MIKKILFTLLAAVLVIGLFGCGQPAGQPVSQSTVQSDKPRETTPASSPSDLENLVDGNNAFAFDLYKVLAKKDGNLFYSPYSISQALAMTYAGARGDTEKAMSDALRFTLSQERLHPAFNSLDLQLKQRGQGAKGKDGEGFRLNIANAIWGQEGYSFLGQFLDVLAQNYGAGMRLVDFINKTEESRLTINNWVSDQTEQRIKDLVPSGALNNMTRLVLTNAIYFNAAWQKPFQKGATSEGTFNLLNGSKITVPMMRQSSSFRYGEGADYEAVELPYDGRELSMVIMLPRIGQFEAFGNSLSGESVQTIIDKMENQQVDLTMPKFEYDSSLGLKEALSILDMGIAFTENADFSGMNGKRDLLIQDVLHKAFVSVDESGTEAAAATAVIVGTTSMPAKTVELKIDRPFISLIRDIPTGSIIFIGRVMNPGK